MPHSRALVLGVTLLTLAVCAPSAVARSLPRVAVAVARSIPDEPKVAGRMTVRDGARVDYRGRIAIERRGQSSQMFPKQSWSVETRTTGGGNRDVSLLGLPEENDWVLYAPYNDKS